MKTTKRQPGPAGLQEKRWALSEEDQQSENERGMDRGDVDGRNDDSDDDDEDERNSLVEKLIRRIGDQLDSEEAPAKASVSDLIRLMQWERELHPRHARKFVVEWIDPKPEEM